MQSTFNFKCQQWIQLQETAGKWQTLHIFKTALFTPSDQEVYKNGMLPEKSLRQYI